MLTRLTTRAPWLSGELSAPQFSPSIFYLLPNSWRLRYCLTSLEWIGHYLGTLLQDSCGQLRHTLDAEARSTAIPFERDLPRIASYDPVTQGIDNGSEHVPVSILRF